MVKNFMFPPVGFGPGSQPGEEDGSELDYLAMPSGMQTFEPRIPMIDDTTAAAPALAVLATLARDVENWREGAGAVAFDLPDLSPLCRQLIAETLGEGEVAVTADGATRREAQESVFAGVWRIKDGDGLPERIEFGPAPSIALERAATDRPAPPMPWPGVVNGPAVLTEILDAVESHQGGASHHVVNLTLLPHTPEDLDYLDKALGRGAVTILSRGYGNCRIEATAFSQVWRVRFYNSQDVLILDTIEICDIPEVACAAPEDIADSAERLREVVEAMQ